jgi:hypothetical protein
MKGSKRLMRVAKKGCVLEDERISETVMVSTVR